ncbi:hypothetical protein EVAR_69031_1 [Eumeta japonica]|uniref:Retrovirus-related Gag polyprotein from transposon gypsy n=1 Tax=Eumeta variegata TaxID=151549 RepID=A0A4C2ADN9_EUMVA|nr:hypothetical protein EVAR_69031_1 [Eumeta japonica]
MEQVNLNQLMQQMANLQLALEGVQQENVTLRRSMKQIPISPVINQPNAVALEPRIAAYKSPNDINLEIFESLSTFDGTRSNYRLWREDATRLMNGISRSLYVFKDELTKLTQDKSSPSEFHDEVSKALTVVTSKIAMSGDPAESIKCMTAHVMEDAVRTFKNGINDNFIRSTLYGNPIKDLEYAYAIAQTIEHDNNHRGFQHNIHQGNNRGHHKSTAKEQPRQQFERYQHFRRPYNLPNQHQQNQLQQNFPKPKLMDISSGNTTQIQ